MTSDVNVLSEREQEILRLLATGASNKEIAQFLHISTNTVKVHLRNIYSKIGVSSRTEAAMRAVNDGIVDPMAEEFIQASVSPLAGTQLVEPGSKRIPQWMLPGLLAIIIALSVGFWQIRESLVRTKEAELTAESGQSPEMNQWKTFSPLSAPRAHMAVAQMGDFLFIIGGDSPGGLLGSVEAYNITTNTWNSRKEKPTPAAEISAVVLGGKIYVPGGRISESHVTDMLEIYDPISDTWRSGKPIPHPVSGYGLAVFEGRIFLFGGWDGSSATNLNYVYDPEIDDWHSIDPMPTPRAYLGTAIAGRRIYLIGGYNGKEDLDVNEIYQPDLAISGQNPWSQGPPLPEPNSSIGTVSIADTIYVIGGKSAKNKQFSTIVLREQSKEWQVFEEPEGELGEGLGVTNQGLSIFVIGGIFDSQYQAINQVYQALYTISLPIISRSTK